MIELHCIKGSVFVFDIQDWKVLRTEHRIIGDIVGCSQFFPSLPVALFPEEVALLLKKNVVKLVQYKQLLENFPKDNEDIYKTISINLLDEERKLIIENRRQQLEVMKEKIIVAKRKKGDTRSSEDIIEEEFKKSTNIDETTMIWPIFIQHLKEIRGEATIVNEKEVLQQTTKTKEAVYEDLWLKGYYVTLGHKFGCDFLAYLGDPILYHAVFIIRCIENNNKEMHCSELVAFGRLGNSVKKRAVLASLDHANKVCYVTLNWVNI